MNIVKQIENFGPNLLGLVTGSKTSRSTKRKYRYKTVLRGRIMRRHFTKKSANDAAKSVSGSYVLPINSPIKKRRTRTRGRKRRTARRRRR